MTQPPPDTGPDPERQYLEQLLRTSKTAWELFRYGYETGLAHSIDHEHLARIIRAMELNYGETKHAVKATGEFIDVLEHRQKSTSNTEKLRGNAAWPNRSRPNASY